jgi:hypothetical protein
MDRLIHQLQLVAKMGNDFGNVHEARAANGFAAEIAIHGPPQRTRVMEEARMGLQSAFLVPIVKHGDGGHSFDRRGRVGRLR